MLVIRVSEINLVKRDSPLHWVIVTRFILIQVGFGRNDIQDALGAGKARGHAGKRKHRTKHRETKQALDERDSKIHELEDTQPRLIVGFQDDAGHLVNSLQLQLNPLPSKPDFDALVEEKQRELLAKQQFGQISPRIATFSPSIKPNPSYKEDVERFLVEYHTWLIHKYEHTVDRAYFIFPIMKNQGGSPAVDVTLEFAMPPTYKKPTKDQQRDFWSAITLEKSGLSVEELEFQGEITITEDWARHTLQRWFPLLPLYNVVYF